MIFGVVLIVLGLKVYSLESRIERMEAWAEGKVGRLRRQE